MASSTDQWFLRASRGTLWDKFSIFPMFTIFQKIIFSPGIWKDGTILPFEEEEVDPSDSLFISASWYFCNELSTWAKNPNQHIILNSQV